MDKDSSNTYSVAIKYIGLVIHAQFDVRSTTGPSPAYAHFPSSHSLKLKIPFPQFYRIALLHTEKTNGFNTLLFHHMDSCGQRGEIIS